MKISPLSIAAIVSSTFASLGVNCPKVDAHGYTTISRNFLCVDGRNFDCGAIIFEPQSLEAPKGFPASGPADGQIASAGIGRFGQLNEQTAFRWLKTDVNAGASLDFTWKFTANHRTTSFEYFITKDAWDPEAPLTRAQFESDPFCSIPFGGAQPTFEGETHACTLPATKSGYHVILAVWTIDDTGAAFYNMNDVLFGGSNPPPSPTNPVPTNPAPTPAPVSVPSPTAPTPSGPLCSTGLPMEAINNCQAFVACADGEVIPNSETPCSAGLLFNQAAQVCDWDFNVDCSGPGADTTEAPTGAPVGTTEAPTGAPVGTTEAPTGAPVGTTEAPTGAPVDTTEAPTGAPVGTTEAPTKAPTEDPTEAPTEAPVDNPGTDPCSSGQPLVAVDGCTAFVYCQGGAVIPNSKTMCASGLLFSSDILACDWADMVDCP